MATYYDLVIRCPACIGKNKTVGPPSQWYHANCGGKIQVGDDAYMRCISCGHKSHIRNWRYACEAHQGDYRPTSSGDFCNAISAIAQVSSLGGKEWLLRIVNNMGTGW